MQSVVEVFWDEIAKNGWGQEGNGTSGLKIKGKNFNFGFGLSLFFSLIPFLFVPQRVNNNCFVVN